MLGGLWPGEGSGLRSGRAGGEWDREGYARLRGTRAKDAALKRHLLRLGKLKGLRLDEDGVSGDNITLAILSAPLPFTPISRPQSCVTEAG